MNNVWIMTDTNSSITAEEAQENGIRLLPMPVIVDGQERTEGVDITHAELYAAMEAGKPVMTSQPSPGEVTAIWDRMLEEGADEIVYIPMSSGLSGSCDMAKVQALRYGGRVWVVDNHRISVTQRSSVYDALYLSRSGKSAEEITRTLEKSAFDSSIYICVNTLKYLKKSNRVTTAGASLAAAMDLHPVLNIRGGKLDAQCVVRGTKHMQKTLIRLLEADLEKRFRFISPSEISVDTAGTFIDPESAKEWQERVQRAFRDFKVGYRELSCSIACHVGSNAVGLGISVLQR